MKSPKLKIKQIESPSFNFGTKLELCQREILHQRVVPVHSRIDLNSRAGARGERKVALTELAFETGLVSAFFSFSFSDLGIEDSESDSEEEA